MRKLKRRLKQFASQHIRSKKNPDKSCCGIDLEYAHLIYAPKKGDKISEMVRNKVCWKCIAWSGVEDKYEW